MTTSSLPAGCIVVGVDGSEHAERAITWSARLAALEGRTLALVHSADQFVLRETATLERQGIDRSELTLALSSAARATLDAARERATLAAPGVKVLTEQVHTDAREALVDLSKDASLIVLGSRGRGPMRTALLGSVSASVAKRAHCPVVVCRPPEHEPSAGIRVIVDAGTDASRPVLEFAFAQASLRGIPITVVSCVWDATAVTGGPAVAPASEDGDLADLRLLTGPGHRRSRREVPRRHDQPGAGARTGRQAPRRPRTRRRHGRRDGGRGPDIGHRLVAVPAHLICPGRPGTRRAPRSPWCPKPLRRGKQR